MASEALQYQSKLLTELIQNAETQATLSEPETDQLCQRVAEANSPKEIAVIWRDLDQTYELLDEEQWTNA